MPHQLLAPLLRLRRTAPGHRTQIGEVGQGPALRVLDGGVALMRLPPVPDPGTDADGDDTDAHDDGRDHPSGDGRYE